MERTPFSFLQSSIQSKRWEVLKAKWKDYSWVTDDVFGNFKEVAAELGITPMQVLWVYMNKHFKALNKYIRNPNAIISEPIEWRIIDAMNYLDFMYGLYSEGEKPCQKESSRDILVGARYIADAMKSEDMSCGLPGSKFEC